jgi:hypothetical protein
LSLVVYFHPRRERNKTRITFQRWPSKPVTPSATGIKKKCKPLNKVKMLQIMLLVFSTLGINKVILMITLEIRHMVKKRPCMDIIEIFYIVSSQGKTFKQKFCR